MHMKIACVIPAWNEAPAFGKSHLPGVVESLTSCIDLIIIVDDGSTDETYETALRLPADVLRHPVNRGQGAALATGTEYALEQDAEIIIHFDADGQFRVQDIETVIKPLLERQADMVFGSRFLDDTTAMPEFKRKVIMPLARFVNKIFFGITLTDPQSGFRAFNRQAAEMVKWKQDQMGHCSEILIEAHRHPLRIQEVPITVVYHHFGQRLSGGFKIIRDFILAKLNS